MKLKRYLAALLAGAMVLTSVPVTGLTVQAEEQEIETGDGELDLDAEEMGLIDPAEDNITVEAEADAETSAEQCPWTNLLTGGKAHSSWNGGTQVEYESHSCFVDKNAFYIDFTESKSVTKLKYYPNNGNVASNGTISSANIYAKTEGSEEYTLIKEKAVFSFSENVAEIPFETAAENVASIKVEVLTAGGNPSNTFISGSEVELYNGEEKISADNLTARADYPCHAGAEIQYICDGNTSTNTHSLWGNESGEKPVFREGEKEITGNNNLYFTFKNPMTIGKFMYQGVLESGKNGCIRRCNLYVTSDSDKETANWTLVQAADEDWNEPNEDAYGVDNRKHTVEFAEALENVKIFRVEVTRSWGNQPDQFIGGNKVEFYGKETETEEPPVEVTEKIYTPNEDGAFEIPEADMEFFNKMGNITVEAAFRYTDEAQLTGEAHALFTLADENGKFFTVRVTPKRADRANQGDICYSYNGAQTSLCFSTGDFAVKNTKWHKLTFSLSNGKAMNIALDGKTPLNEWTSPDGHWPADFLNGNNHYTKAYVGKVDPNGSYTTSAAGENVDFPGEIKYLIVSSKAQNPNVETQKKNNEVVAANAVAFDALKAENLAEADYTEESWTAFKEAYDKAVADEKDWTILDALDARAALEEKAPEATNVALNKPIVAFDGTENNSNEFAPENMVNGNMDDRWSSSVKLKELGDDAPEKEGKAYFVLDLGENTETTLERMKIQWYAKAWATEYEIQTSDVCTVDENRRMDLTSDADEWTTVKKFTRASESVANIVEEQTFDAGTKLKRYVRFIITRLNSKATGGETPSIRELELYGVQTVKEQPQPPVDPLAAEKKALQAAIDAAQAVVDAGKGDYTDASWTEFTAKLDAAKAALAADDATADSLTAAKTALEEAQGALAKEEQPPVVESKKLPVTKITVPSSTTNTTYGDAGGAEALYDDNADTVWHTAYAGDSEEAGPKPTISNTTSIGGDLKLHDLTGNNAVEFELEKPSDITKLRYLPKSHEGNGFVTKYAVYTAGEDGQYTADSVAEGEIARDNDEWKELEVKASGVKYVKFVATQVLGKEDTAFICAKELHVYGAEVVTKTALKAPKLTVSSVNADVTGDNLGDPKFVGEYTPVEGGQEVTYAESDGVYGFKGDFTVGDALDAAGSEPVMIKFKMKIDEEPSGDLTIFEKGTGNDTQFNFKACTFDGVKLFRMEAGFYTNNNGGQKYPATGVRYDELPENFWGAWHEVVIMYKGARSTLEMYIDENTTSQRNPNWGLQMNAPVPEFHTVAEPAQFHNNDGVQLADFKLYKGDAVPTSATNLAEVNAQLAADAVPAYSIGVTRDLKDYTIATAWSKTEDDADKVTATLTVLDPEKAMFDETSKPTSIIVGKEYVTDIEVEVAEDGQSMTVSYAYPPLVRKIRSINLTVDAPVTGRTPAKEAATEDAGYTAGDLAWSIGEEAFAGEAFAAATAYSASVELTAKEGYEFLANVDDIVVKVNGEDASIEATETGVKVSYTFAATASEEDQIAKDKEDFEKALAEAKDAKNDNQYYTEDSWTAYQAALADVEKMPLTSLEEIQEAAAALEAAKKLLVRNVKELQENPDVTVVAPVTGAAPADAVLTKGGALESTADITYENMKVDDEGGISGQITAENAENSVFNVTGSNKFLFHFQMKLDEPVSGTKSVIGKMNKQYGLQVEASRVLLFGKTTGNWLEVDYTIPADGWYGVWHDVVAIFNGEQFELYVDGVAGTIPSSHSGRTGQLMEDAESIFTIGYNATEADQLFPGKLRDVHMYIDNEAAGQKQVPDYEIADDATAENIMAMFAEKLEGQEESFSLTGLHKEQKGYTIEKTTWTPADEAFVQYRDYTVEVVVKANEGYVFAEDAAAVLRAGDSVLEGAEVKVIDDGDRMTITYTFQGEEHPRVTLQKYLESDAVADCYVVVGNELKNQISEEDTTRKWTIASWNSFVEGYRAAYDAVEDGTLEPAEYALARVMLERIIAGMNLAAETCECTVSGITGFTNVTKEIEMGKNLEIALPTNLGCTHSAAGSCLVSGHEDAGVTFTFAIGTTNTAGASIKDGKLIATKAGSVEVIATAHKGEATTDATATYTIKDKKATPDEKKELTDEINKITETYEPNADKYTQESWNALAAAIAEAKKLGASATSVQIAAAQKKIADAKAALVIKDKKALEDLIAELEQLNADDYTVASWNAMIDVYKKAKDLPADASFDDYSKAFNDLTAAKAALVTKADELAAAKAEVDKALAAADAIYKAGQKNYSADTWKVFADAYTAAKNAPANADAAMLKKLAADLSAAQNGLKAGLSNNYEEVVGGVRYKVVSAAKKTAKVVGGKSKSMKSLFVPATVKLNGVKCKVVQVAPKAFKGYTKLKKVKLGKNVTTIGKQSFMGCKKLTNIIVLSKSLKSIKTGAFKKTAAKKVVVKLPKKLKASQRKKLQKQFTKAGLSKKAKFK